MEQKTMKKVDVRKLTTVGMLSALAFLVMLVFRVPIMPAASFLKLDLKDVVITIGGLIYGPLTAAMMALVVSVIEMITVSESGYWGLLMNVLASCAFACTAAFIYQKMRTATGAAVGVVAGALAMTAAMLLWNYFITPIYMGTPREYVAAMLLPVFLPFNLVKTGINAALTLFLYKPVVGILRKTGSLPKPVEGAPKGKMNFGVALVGLVLLASCVVYILIAQGIM